MTDLADAMRRRSTADLDELIRLGGIERADLLRRADDARELLLAAVDERRIRAGQTAELEEVMTFGPPNRFWRAEGHA